MANPSAGTKMVAVNDRGRGEATTERRQSMRLLLVLVLIGGFFFVELAGARIARSDVLEADAFHLLMDVFAIAISLLAMRLASRRPSARFTFGLRRLEPLVALLNGVLIVGVAMELGRDAALHLGHPMQAPRSGWMLVVATAALVMNGLNAWLLHGVMGHAHHGHAHHGHAHHGHAHHEHAHDEHAHDGHAQHEHAHDEHAHDEHAHDEHAHHGHQLNLRGAWLHLLGDALGSLAAFVAGVSMRFGAPAVVDPLASFVVVAILIIGAYRLVRDAGLVLLDAAPAHLAPEKIEKALLSVPGVERVSSLHVWSLGTGHDAISAHLRTSSTDPKLGSKATELLRHRFTVEYVTVQIDVVD